jgi:hypothetical protein
MKYALEKVLRHPAAGKMATNFFRYNEFTKKNLKRVQRLHSKAFPNGINARRLKIKPNMPVRHPVIFGCVFSCIKTGGADYFVQKYVEGKESMDIDYKRVGAFAFFGLAYLGFIQYMLYVPVLTRVLFPRAQQYAKLTLKEKLSNIGAIKNALAQVAVDSIILAPFIYYPVFYLMKEWTMTLDDTKRHQDWFQTGFNKFITNISDDMNEYVKVWVPAQLVNFLFLPHWARIPFTATVSVGWSMILSLMRGDDDNNGIETVFETSVAAGDSIQVENKNIVVIAEQQLIVMSPIENVKV